MRLILCVLVGVLLVGTVGAGSVEDLDYMDFRYNYQYRRVIADGDVRVDADTVGGLGVADLYVGRGNSFGVSTLGRWLTGDKEFFSSYPVFTDYIKERYVPRSELELANKRIDRLEAMIVGFRGEKLLRATASITSQRTNSTVRIEGWSCQQELCVST